MFYAYWDAINRRTVYWNEMNGALGHLCVSYRLNWARRTSWGWWDKWDDTALQTQNSKFELWRSEAEHLPLSHRGSPHYCFFETHRPEWGSNPRSPTFKQAALMNPLTSKFEFSPTWSCVSLTRSTTSGEWKSFRFDKMDVDYFQILLINVTF